MEIAKLLYQANVATISTSDHIGLKNDKDLNLNNFFYPWHKLHLTDIILMCLPEKGFSNL